MQAGGGRIFLESHGTQHGGRKGEQTNPMMFQFNAMPKQVLDIRILQENGQDQIV